MVHCRSSKWILGEYNILWSQVESGEYVLWWGVGYLVGRNAYRRLFLRIVVWRRNGKWMGENDRICGSLMVHASIHLARYNTGWPNGTRVSPIVKFVFLSTQPPPSITHLSRLQEPVFFRFRWMVGRGEIVFVCLCSSRTGEGKEVFRDFDLEMSAAHFFGANNIQYYTGFFPPSHIASQRAQLSTFAFALLHLSSRTL